MKKLFILAILCPCMAYSKQIIIAGEITGGATGDSVTVTIIRDGIDLHNRNKTIYGILKKESFKIVFDITIPTYINIAFKKTDDIDWQTYNAGNLDYYLVEPGDNIYIKKNGSTINFYGRGCSKFIVLRSSSPIKTLCTYRRFLSPIAYAILHTDILCRDFRRLPAPNPGALYSIYYPGLVLKRAPLVELFKYCNNHYRGMLREKMLYYLLSRSGKDPLISLYLGKARTIFRSRHFVPLLNELIAANAKGVTAYNFTLVDSDGITHHLSDYLGKTVVIDFWFTGCPGCRNLKLKLDSLEPTFSEIPVVFLTISVDRDKSVWLKSLRDRIYTTAYSKNLLGTTTVFDKYNIIGFPSLVLIDKNGKLWHSVTDPRLDSGKALAEAIRTMQ